jgi:hypothetical protein
MDVSTVCEYLDTKESRIKLESQFKKLESQLTKTRSDEEALSRKIDPNSFITAKAVKVINEFLSHPPLWFGVYPVSFAQLTLKGGNATLNIVFAQPIFSGWRTEKPHVSYQVCSWSLETPALPDENHIPEYQQIAEWCMDFVCWEIQDDKLTLWLRGGRCAEFRKES